MHDDGGYKDEEGGVDIDEEDEPDGQRQCSWEY